MIRLEKIEPSEPESLYWTFDSKLRLDPAEEAVFALNPYDRKEIPVAQYDSVNRFERLGVELLCFARDGTRNLDPEQSYTISIVASAERGRRCKSDLI